MSAAAPLDRQLCFSLYSTSMAITRVYKPIMDRMGITFPQYIVLLSLWEEDGRTVGAIAERLWLESSTVTPLVKRLEAAGLVTRMRDSRDERQVHVSLTERGAGMQQECGCLAEAVLEQAGITRDNLDVLNKDVQAFRKVLIEGQLSGVRRKTSA